MACSNTTSLSPLSPPTQLCQEGVEEKAFSFNMVFTPESSQQEIFESTGMRKLISMAIEGYEFGLRGYVFFCKP